jgi:hypothetical protein
VEKMGKPREDMRKMGKTNTSFSEIKKTLHFTDHSRLGGLVVSVLATGPKGRGFDGILRVIKIRSTPSFGWEIKSQVTCRKILRHVKGLLKSHGDE